MKFLDMLANFDMIADGINWKKLSIKESSFDDSSGYVWFTNGLLLQWGRASITPTGANTVTSITINFPKSYSNVPDVKLIPQVQYPNIVTTSVGMGTTLEAGKYAFLIYMTRTNTASTNYQWLATGYKEVS